MINLSREQLFICLFLAIFLCNPVFGFSLNDSIYNKNIHAIQIFKTGNELSLPVLELNSGETFDVSFDELGASGKSYYFKLTHCNQNWEPEDLNYNEFMDGFESNAIKKRNISTNTTIAYQHYGFQFPNEDVKILISGNFLLTVFEENNESKIAFTKRFYIYETLADIDFSLLRAQLPKYMQRYQQYKLKIKPLISDINDFKEDIKVYMYKNFDRVSCKRIFYNYLEEKTLVFDDMDSCIFPGGNEFRNFDIKNIKYQSPRIQSMYYLQDTFQVELYEDSWRIRKPYLSDQDINGKFFIENSRGMNKNIDGEYVKVHFYLPSDFLPDGNIYVHGALTDWKLDANSAMEYNFNTKRYEKALLVKQGYYNYVYVFYNKEFNIIDEAFVESNHFETENEYQVFVYYKSSISRYDRLIGFKSVSSVK